MKEVQFEKQISQNELFEIGENFLQRLNSVIKHSQFYPESHPILVESINSFRDYLKIIFEEFGRMQINFYEGEIFLFGRFVPRLSKSFEKIVEFFEKRNMLEITILPGVTDSEIYEFSKAVSDKPENIESSGGIQTILANLDITHIIITSAKPTKSSSSEDDFDSDFVGISEETYMYAVSIVKNIANSVLSGMPVQVQEAKKLVDNLVEKVLENPDALIRLSVLKNYDEDTFYHSVNVMLLSITLAASLGFERPVLAALGLSALLHDIGKVKIPPEILKKPTSLTKEEWKTMQMHVIWGAESLLSSKGLNKIAVVVALEHHLGYDKSGYPRLYLVSRPHIFSRVVNVVDVYDALTSQRAYRKPTLPDNALRLIHVQAGKKLDPLIAKAFIRMMGIYPVGSVVKLNTGEYAVVVKPGKDDITRPKVIVVLDENLNSYEQPIKVDLLHEARKGSNRHTILEAVDPSKVGIDPKSYVVPQE
jgi:HD-GYP domain-containing protein (c-di-GMP phosphodiesterase class II)